MKKVLGETQTLRTGCSKVEPNIFAPPQTPFLGVKDGQNLIHWRWSSPIGEDRCMQFQVIVVTDHKATNTQRPPVTNRTDNNSLHC